MKDLNGFYNRGFGWICRKCEDQHAPSADSKSRLMREGEAESKFGALTSVALARWADRERTMLECPRCGSTERLADEPSG